MRAFIAIEIDPEVKKKLTRMIRHFEKLSSRVKWIKPSAMHLTLKFLGSIDETEADQLKNILDKVSKKHSCFDLSCSGIGTFPLKSKNPKVIWIGIQDNSFIKGVYADIETEAEKIGFSKEKRSFHPHLTLGRVKKKAEIQKLIPELERTKNKDFGKTQVNGLTLFKSTLTPQGAVYDILFKSSLR
jgi:RNA 2',3'-cyclic 3'-phosphodiesterase